MILVDGIQVQKVTTASEEIEENKSEQVKHCMDPEQCLHCLRLHCLHCLQLKPTHQ
jgi:hypothetical protein